MYKIGLNGGLNLAYSLDLLWQQTKRGVVTMKIEMLEKLINEATKNKRLKDVNFKYELRIGEYPIKITMGIN